ncbi:UDP-N-acetylenolpyruvoylglucosamine reductase [endosymbiont of Sipalinus gigas]|uniref:UDP-N-acetylmuramate dehydrogenase n=1 Tax=endosymbiont of Sipalinus gigas TaxID=1972134 RepID=UPI000DC6EBF4|nr:UDP-N-acetylmuramate dehydrogenase [endosymbiont of Sipalinus gigas]BBA85219.1 UDP-N-acetylenolpyruvoylglucosamine reductase [endosymbiont of Sipalinus gigas]
MIKKNSSINKINSFGINIKCKYLAIANNLNDIKRYIYISINKKIPIIFVGDISNTIFLENFCGFIVLNRIYGINIYNYKKYWHLHIHSGESWSKIVNITIKKNIYGLENLSMIPGRVGSAVINNIGAYGVEISDIISYVYIINIYNFNKKKINNNECSFNYRYSIFKTNKYKDYIILSIGLNLKKNWSPILNHKKIFCLKKYNLNSKKIYKIINNIRANNIPNFNIISNCGSFFKNCILKNKNFINLKNKYKLIPNFKISNNKFKIYSGWLIDKCNLKSFFYKNLYIYNKNSLVIVNLGENTNGNDILFFIRIIKKVVKRKFNIKLENEVLLLKNNFIKKLYG